MAAPTFSVILHHLSPDAKQAGASHPDHPMAAATLEQLIELINNLGEFSTTFQETPGVTPEIRIQTAREELQVRAVSGGLRYDSWDTKVGGLILSPEEIIAKIGGPNVVPKRPRRVGATPAPTGGKPRWLKIAGLAVAIIAVNATTVWLFFSPPNTLLPRHELLAEADTRKIFSNLAGEYETGGEQGDRRLTIAPDGTVKIAYYGAKRAVLRESAVNARGAKVEGIPALITIDPPSVVQIKDANTVILYGDTYRRRAPAT
jgi:hypothetical protein